MKEPIEIKTEEQLIEIFGKCNFQNIPMERQLWVTRVYDEEIKKT